MAYSARRPSQVSATTLPMPAVARRIISARSAMLNIGEGLAALTMTSTTTRSNIREARRTMLRWPSVMGSKLPGQMAVIIVQASFLYTVRQTLP